jgi:hypothetical protein
MTIDNPMLKSEVVQTSRQLSTFFVADLFFGVDVLSVQEVLRFQQVTQVPKAPDVIEGLINRYSYRPAETPAIAASRRRPTTHQCGHSDRRRRGEFAG